MSEKFNANIKHILEHFVGKILLPKKLVGIAVKLPSTINFAIIDSLLNKVFAQQVRDRDFDFFQGRILQIEFSDARLCIGLTYRCNKLNCIHFDSQPAKATSTLSINVSDAIRLIKQEVDPDTLFFNRKLKISGDTEFAHRVKNIIDTLDPALIPKALIPALSGYQRIIE